MSEHITSPCCLVRHRGAISPWGEFVSTVMSCNHAWGHGEQRNASSAVSMVHPPAPLPRWTQKGDDGREKDEAIGNKGGGKEGGRNEKGKKEGGGED